MEIKSTNKYLRRWTKLVLLFFIFLSVANVLASVEDSKLCLPEPSATAMKSWIEKLKNFQAPFETGSLGGSYFYAVGATLTGPKSFEQWKAQSVILGFDQSIPNAKLESVWLDGQQSVKDSKPLVEKLLTKIEKDLLETCCDGNCKIKLNDDERKSLCSITKNPEQLERTYLELIQFRLSNYFSHRNLFGYEGSRGSYKLESLNLNSGNPLAGIASFGKKSKQVKSTGFGFEFLDRDPKKHKPTLGVISRECGEISLAKEKIEVCEDVVVYNNHYFDFWGKVTVFLPACNNQKLALVYEVIDVDQLKGNSVIGALFGSQMRNILGAVMEARLKQLHMLGN